MPDEALRRVHQLARNQGMPRIIQNFQYERAPGEPLLPQENVNVVETEKGDETEEQAAGPLYIEISRYLETIYTGTGVMARVMHGDIIYSMFLE